MRRFLFLGILIPVFFLQSCGKNPVSPVAPKDSVGYFSAMTVTVRGTPTDFDPVIEVLIDSAGAPISHQPGDTLSYNGYVIPSYDSLNLWQGFLNEVVDSGKYVLTFTRKKDSTTVSGSFTISLPAFHIARPQSGATVTLSTHTNDTIFYTPAGGEDITGFYASTAGLRVTNYDMEPDNGKYHIADVSSAIGKGPGYLYMIRHLAGSLDNPTPFKRVGYDLYQSSKHVDVVFNW